MNIDFSEFEQRKKDHIELALDPMHQTLGYNSFDKYRLIHDAIPDLNFSDVQIFIQSEFSNWTKPFFISSMTAGHEHALTINRNLLAACKARQWAMGVGSQRREIDDKNASYEWIKLRRDYSDVVMMANIGLAQLITTPLDILKRLAEAIEAKLFIIHCNPLQEVIQPEGTPNFHGAWQVLENFIKEIEIPVVIKETGCGFSLKTIERLNHLGAYAIDVSGLGGTHWGRIEGSRAVNNQILTRTAQTFANWGIPTADVLIHSKSLELKSELWGSGGIRQGLDAAKALAMGAKRVGIAHPVLKAALENEEAVLTVMDTFEYELRVAMFCSGCKAIDHLSDIPLQMVS